MASVEVMCPNAHRVIVKTTPNTKLLEVLDEACKKKGFLPSEEYELKHGRKVVNLSDTIRFSGLPNHAKLEMVKAEKPRNLENPVTIGLQLDNGTRVMHTCPPPTSLWDLLLQCSQLPNGPNKEQLTSKEDGQTPVVIYMRDEVMGEYALKHTTLKKLGLLGGRAALRLVYRSVDEAVLQAAQEKIEAEQMKQARLEAKAKAASVASQVSTPSPQSPTPPSPAETRPESAMSVESVRDVPSKTDLKTASRVEEPMEVSESQSAPSPDLPQPGPSQPSAPSSEQQKEKKMKKLLPGMYMGGQATDPEQLAAAAPRQQLPRGPVRAVILPLADFKFPEATKGQNLYHNELNDYKKEDYIPCDREEVLFNMNAVQRDNAGNPQEVPDDFFEVTVSDVQRMYSDLQKQAAASEEQPLMTRELRLAQAEAKLNRYPHAVIRFHFPDRHILQAVFRPRETVNALYKFVKSFLEDKEMSFYLYTTPPRKVLKDKAQQIHEADLIPLSVVHFGSDAQRSSYLSAAVLGEVSSSEKAEEVVCKHFQKNTDGDSQASQSSSSKRSIAGSASQPSTSARASASSDGAKQVPKWFKVGKK